MCLSLLINKYLQIINLTNNENEKCVEHKYTSLVKVFFYMIIQT